MARFHHREETHQAPVGNICAGPQRRRAGALRRRFATYAGAEKRASVRECGGPPPLWNTASPANHRHHARFQGLLVAQPQATHHPHDIQFSACAALRTINHHPPIMYGLHFPPKQLTFCCRKEYDRSENTATDHRCSAVKRTILLANNFQICPERGTCCIHATM
jgi:hypothetical protein